MISAEYTITDLNQLIYNFAFDYLKKKYVKVSSKNITTGVVTNCTYGVHYVVVDKTIELLQSVGAVGDVLRIVRETSTSEQIVSWNDASILKASDMSLAQVQQLHILEEYSEHMSTYSLSLDINGQYDAKNSRIVNLTSPQTDTDAVNKYYVDTIMGTLLTAQQSVTLSQSWAIGDILNRPEGSSKYWAEQAKILKTEAENSANSALNSKKEAEALALQDYTGIMKVSDIITKGPLIDVRAFGAVGDGVIDDTVAIQSALDYQKIKGGIVFFPPGTYCVSTLTINKNDAHIMGCGFYQSKLCKINEGVMIRNGLWLDGVVIEDLGIINSTALTAEQKKNITYIGLQGGVTLNRLYFMGNYGSVISTSYGSYKVNDVIVRMYDGYGCKLIQFGTDTPPVECKFYNFTIQGQTGKGTGLYLKGTDTIKLNSCNFQNIGAPVLMEASNYTNNLIEFSHCNFEDFSLPLTVLGNININNCEIYSSLKSDNAILIVGGSGINLQGNIIGNSIKDCIKITGGNQIWIKNNYIHRPNTSGYSCINATNINYLDIIGNTFSANIGGGANAYPLIRLDSCTYVNEKANSMQTASYSPANWIYATNCTGSYFGCREEPLTASMTLYVDGVNGSDSGLGISSGIGAFATIGRAVSCIPKNVNTTITINISNTTYAETINLTGFIDHGGLIVIQGSGTTNVTKLYMRNCTSRVQVSNINFTATDTCIDCEKVDYLNLTSVSTTVSGSYFLLASHGTHVTCNASTVSNRSRIAVAMYNSTMTISVTSGSGNTIALEASNASIISKKSTFGATYTTLSFVSEGGIVNS